MTRDDIHRALLAALAETAPDAGVYLFDPTQPLQQQVALDSAHWLSFVAAVQSRLGVELSDADSSLITTLDQLEHYCEERLASRA